MKKIYVVLAAVCIIFPAYAQIKKQQEPMDASIGLCEIFTAKSMQ